MENLNLLEMETYVGGMDEDIAGFLDGFACGVGIGMLVSGGLSWLGAFITGWGCARAFGF